jgi:TRAP-type C4-dicarboxylate transport system permease small subunit
MDSEKDLNFTARWSLRIASVALGAMMVVVVLDVSLRKVFSKPVTGAYDLVELGLLIMVFFGMSGVIARNGEILIDLIDGLLPARGVRLLQAIAAVASLSLFLFFAWAMIGPAWDAWKWGGYSLELGLPNWGKWALAFVGLAGVLWVSIGRVWGVLRGQTDQAADKGQEK